MKAFSGRINNAVEQSNVKIDKKDKRILSLLVKNSRMPRTQIAKNVRLSRDAVDYRIKRLENARVILGFFPNVSFDKLGYSLFHVFLLLDDVEPDRQKILFAYLQEHPNVTSVVEYTDRWDVEIVLVARNVIEFDEILSALMEKFPVILEHRKIQIIKRYNANFLPPILEERRTRKLETPDIEPVHIDSTDIKLLRLLSQDCRASTYKLGAKLGVSADTVSYRMKNLLREGVIRNFTILVDLSKLGFQMFTYSTRVKLLNKKYEGMFTQFLEKNKHVVRSAKGIGVYDLLLYIAVQNQREYHKIIKELKNMLAPVIKSYDTWVTYREYSFNPMPAVISG